MNKTYYFLVFVVSVLVTSSVVHGIQIHTQGNTINELRQRGNVDSDEVRGRLKNLETAVNQIWKELKPQNPPILNGTTSLEPASINVTWELSTYGPNKVTVVRPNRTVIVPDHVRIDPSQVTLKEPTTPLKAKIFVYESASDHKGGKLLYIYVVSETPLKDVKMRAITNTTALVLNKTQSLSTPFKYDGGRIWEYSLYMRYPELVGVGQFIRKVGFYDYPYRLKIIADVEDDDGHRSSVTKYDAR